MTLPIDSQKLRAGKTEYLDVWDRSRGKKGVFFKSRVRCHLSLVPCHLSHYICSLSLFICHLSHITKTYSSSYKRSPCYLPHYAQQAGSPRQNQKRLNFSKTKKGKKARETRRSQASLIPDPPTTSSNTCLKKCDTWWGGRVNILSIFQLPRFSSLG